jgi:predicted nucleic acid-binding protein
VLVVVDTGPLISLSVIGQLNLLDALYFNIAIPEAVWHELESHIDRLSIPDARRFQNNVIPIKEYKVIDTKLGLGEKEAILLYDQLHADRLLIEDNEARIFAESRGIRCTGTLAVLIDAKDEHLIPELRSLFAELLIKGRYFSKDFLNQILHTKNETSL